SSSRGGRKLALCFLVSGHPWLRGNRHTVPPQRIGSDAAGCARCASWVGGRRRVSLLTQLVIATATTLVVLGSLERLPQRYPDTFHPPGDAKARHPRAGGNSS